LAGHIAEFVDGAWVRARPAKRRQIGDHGAGLDHHGLVAAKYLQRGVPGRGVDGIVQRIEPGQAMTRADLDLAPPDLDGVGQEHVGAGQINLHFRFGLP
jgi:hypothetical protein